MLWKVFVKGEQPYNKEAERQLHVNGLPQFTKWIKCSDTTKQMLREKKRVQRRLFSFEQRGSTFTKRVVKKPKGTT